MYIYINNSGETHGEPGLASRWLPCPNLRRSKRLSAQNGGAGKYRAITATVFKLRFTQKIFEMLNSYTLSPKTRDGITVIKIIIVIKKVRFMFIFIVYQRLNIEFYCFI